MARTIVPVELQRRDLQRAAVLKDALQVVDVSLFLVHVGGSEETRWRHLFGVAHHDQSLSAGDGSHGLTRRHLGSLVENHQVKLFLRKVKKLCHRHRTHQHTRAQPRHQLRNLVEEVTQGETASAIRDVAVQKSYLAAVVQIVGHPWNLGSQLCVELLL